MIKGKRENCLFFFLLPKSSSNTMAPTKSTQFGVTKSIVSLSRRAISTRTQQQKVHIDGLQNAVPSAGKRKADASPVRIEKGFKRSALGNVTNAVLNALEDSKKLTRSKADTKKSTTLTNQSNDKCTENHDIFVDPNAIKRQHKVVTRSSARVNDTTKATVNDATVGLKKFNISSTVVKGKKKTETTVNNNNAKPNSKAANAKVLCQMPSSGSESDNQVELKPNTRRLSTEFDLLDSEESHYMSALEDLYVFHN